MFNLLFYIQNFAVRPDTETVTIGTVKLIYLGVYNFKGPRLILHDFLNYVTIVRLISGFLKHKIFGAAETMLVTDTCQFEDYFKYDFAAVIDTAQKIKRRSEEFPKDCRKTFDMGAKFVRQT